MTQVTIKTSTNQSLIKVQVSPASVIKVKTAGPQGPAGAGVAVGGNTGDLLVRGAGPDYTTSWQPPEFPNNAPRSITIAEPQNNDSFTIFKTDREILISSVTGLVQGTSSPSVTYELRYASDRSTSGTLATVSDTVTNSTTGDAATVQNQPIPSGRYVWVNITNVSGIVTEFNVSIAF